MFLPSEISFDPVMHVRWTCIVVPLAVAACSTARESVAPRSCMQVGLASWYRPGDHRSADGEHYGPHALVAAHASLPFGTRVLVTDVANGRSVIVRIGDRGPFARGRIVDLSPAAAAQLGLRQEGVASVRLEIPKPEQASVSACPFDRTGSM